MRCEMCLHEIAEGVRDVWDGAELFTCYHCAKVSELILRLYESADDAGCSDGLIVVSKSALDNVVGLLEV